MTLLTVSSICFAAAVILFEALGLIRVTVPFEKGAFHQTMIRYEENAVLAISYRDLTIRLDLQDEGKCAYIINRDRDYSDGATAERYLAGKAIDHDHKRILAHNEVYLSSADLFNDPFDTTLPNRYKSQNLTPDNIFK